MWVKSSLLKIADFVMKISQRWCASCILGGGVFFLPRDTETQKKKKKNASRKFTSAAMKDTNPWLVGQYCWNDWDMSLSRPSMYWKSKSGKRRSSTFCAEAPSPATSSDIDGMSSSIITIVLPLMPLLLLVVANTSCMSTLDVEGYTATSCIDCGPGDEFWLSDAVDTDGLTSLSPYLKQNVRHYHTITVFAENNILELQTGSYRRTRRSPSAPDFGGGRGARIRGRRKVSRTGTSTKTSNDKSNINFLQGICNFS